MINLQNSLVLSLLKNDLHFYWFPESDREIRSLLELSIEKQLPYSLALFRVIFLYTQTFPDSLHLFNSKYLSIEMVDIVVYDLV